jgi:hypothetical protein
MYFNPSYMNPIAQQPMQQEFSQQPTQEPLEGLASLAPTQPSPPSTMQPISPQMGLPPGGIQPIQDNNPFPINRTHVTSPPGGNRTHGAIPGTGYAEGTGPLAPGNKINDPLRFNQITAPQQIPERYRQGYEDFYNQNPNDYMRIGGAAVSYVTTPQGETIQFGDTGGASNFRRYLESIGETPKPNYGNLSVSTQPIAQDNNAFPIGNNPNQGIASLAGTNPGI